MNVSYVYVGERIFEAPTSTSTLIANGCSVAPHGVIVRPRDHYQTKVRIDNAIWYKASVQGKHASTLGFIVFTDSLFIVFIDSLCWDGCLFGLCWCIGLLG